MSKVIKIDAEGLTFCLDLNILPINKGGFIPCINTKSVAKQLYHLGKDHNVKFKTKICIMDKKWGVAFVRVE